MGAIENSYKPRSLRVQSVVQLAVLLDTSVAELAYLAENAGSYYSSFARLKKDGVSIRTINAPKPRLRKVLRRIKSKIFDRVVYASFLHGGIRKRSTFTNAASHVGARVMICLDISKFYDNISERETFRIFRDFFRFPPEVSELLSRLCTKDGVVAQGSNPSSFIAQLIFWREEAAVASTLENLGIAYTRFVDDLTMSSTTDIDGRTIGTAIGLVRSMAGRHGLVLKRRKEVISRRHGVPAQRTSSSSMCVTGCRVGARHISIPGDFRAQIRNEAHRLLVSFVGGDIGPHDASRIRSVLGKVNYVQQLHPTFGRKQKAGTSYYADAA